MGSQSEIFSSPHMLRCSFPRASRQLPRLFKREADGQVISRYSSSHVATRSTLRRVALRTSIAASQSLLPQTTQPVYSSVFLPVQRYYASNPDDFPPHTALEMPALSPTMTKGTLVRWLKQTGDQVSVGDALAEMETDKATVSWDSMDDGFFVKGFVEDGAEDIPVGQVVALLAEDKADCDKFDGYEPPEGSDESGEESSSKSESKKEKSEDAPKTQKIDLNDKKSEKKSAPASEPKESKPKATKSSAPKRSAGDRIIASPVARKRAEENGIDLANVEGSGPGGRIVLRDIEEYEGEVGTAASDDSQVFVSTQSAQADYEDIPNSKIRKVIAQRLTESKQSIPHYYLTVECCVDRLQEIRKQLNDQGKGKYKLSVNDFVIKASAMALRRVPDVNSTWNEKSIRRYHSVNINVAVNSDIGLFTPLISHADNKGLVDISSSVRELAGKAQDGKLTPDELQVGTFTVSNLGMFGIRNFAAVINPPQAAILAVGGIETRVVEENGSWKESNFMTCTLSCDHRVVDGAIGANWLKEFKARMEDPVALLL